MNNVSKLLSEVQDLGLHQDITISNYDDHNNDDCDHVAGDEGEHGLAEPGQEVATGGKDRRTHLMMMLMMMMMTDSSDI